MKMQFDCLPCIFRQTLESARMSVKDENVQKDILKRFSKMIPEAIDDEISAPELAADIQAYIKQITGKNDPYKELKIKNLQTAHKIKDLVIKEIEQAEDPFLASLLMAAMGNSIDAGVSLDVDIELNIERALKNSFRKSDYQRFTEDLKDAKQLLFIADNTGEAVFDKLLLQKLHGFNLDIKYAVREVPILNDITKKEALELGIDEYADIISSGSRAPGVLMKYAGEEFSTIFQSADIILSKGQGNLEGLYEDQEGIYYLLKAKCRLISDILGVDIGDFLFIYR